MPDKKPFLRSLSLRSVSGSNTDPGHYFSHLPVLETERLMLRPLRMRDAEDLFRTTSDAEVARYVLWAPHRTVSETRGFIRWMHHIYHEGQPGSWCIELKETGRVIGTVGYMWYSSENNAVEIGYSIARSCWNKGIMTEALQAVLNSAFQHLRVNRVEAQFDLRNPASGRVMEKCGLRQEGVLRDRVFNKGEYIDVALYSILAREFREMHPDHR